MDWVNFQCKDLSGITNIIPMHRMTADLSNIEFDTDAPIVESVRLVHDISKRYKPPYYLLVSGGIDSQATLYAWKESKIPFKAISFRYNKTFNDHDLHTLELYSKRHNIDVTFIDIDYFDFLNNDVVTYSTKYICNSPQILFYMKFCDAISDGTLIFSGSYMGMTGFRLTYSQLGLLNYKIISNRSMVPYFLTDNAKISGSFFKTEYDFVQSTIEGGTPDSWYFPYSARCMIYKNGGFDIIPSLSKYTGFENYKVFFDNINDSLAKRQKSINRRGRHNFDILYRWPLYKINNYLDSILLEPDPVKLYLERKSKKSMD